MKNFLRHMRRRKAPWIIGVLLMAILGVVVLYRPQIQQMMSMLPHMFMQDHGKMDHMMMGDMKMDDGMTSMQPPGPATSPTSPMPTMLTPQKRQLIGVQTTTVEERALETKIRAFGRAEYDERLLVRVNLRVAGWIEELFADFTGKLVRKGAPLFTLYSPDLVTSQNEYLLALEARNQVAASPLPDVLRHADAMVEAARSRLRLWTLTDVQIDELAKRGTVQTSVSIASPATGFVIAKTAVQGMYVTPNTDLYTIVDLSNIWIHVEVYEYELPFVAVGQQGTVTLQSFPGEAFSGTVTYVYPTVNPESRTVLVRIEVPNPDFRLKPEMYAEVAIPVARGTSLAVPEEAVVDSGTRTVVFVEKGAGIFEPRQVKLGPKVGQYYEVLAGIAAGEHVVTSGNFLIDSESRLMASGSMMGALGMGGIRMEQATMGEMDMGGMGMPGMEDTKGMKNMKSMPGMMKMPNMPGMEGSDKMTPDHERGAP